MLDWKACIAAHCVGDNRSVTIMAISINFPAEDEIGVKTLKWSPYDGRGQARRQLAILLHLLNSLIMSFSYLEGWLHDTPA